MTAYVRQLTKEEGDVRLANAARKYTWIASDVTRIASADDVHYYIYLHELNQKVANGLDKLSDEIAAKSGFGTPLVYFPIRPRIYDAYLCIKDSVDNSYLTKVANHLKIEVYNTIKHEFNQMRSPVRPGSFIKLLSYSEYMEMARMWGEHKDSNGEIKAKVKVFKNLIDHRFIICMDTAKENTEALNEYVKTNLFTFDVEDLDNRSGFILPVAPEEDAEGMMKTLATAFGLEIYHKQVLHSNDRRIRVVDGEFCKRQIKILLESPPAISGPIEEYSKVIIKCEKLLRQDIRSGIVIYNIPQRQAWDIETSHPMALRYYQPNSLLANVLLSYSDDNAENLEKAVQWFSKFLNIPINRTTESPIFPGQKISAELAIEKVQLLRELITEYHSEISTASVWADASHTYVENSIATIPDALKGASIVLWTEDMWNAGVSGCETFTDKILDRETVNLNPAPSVWMWDHVSTGIRLPIPIDFQLPDDYKGNIACIYLCQTVRITEDSPHMSAYGRTPLRMHYNEIDDSLHKGDIQNIGLRFVFVFRSQNSVIPILRCLPCIYIGDKISDYQAMLIAALKFMHIDIIVKEPVRPQRQYRRRAERENRKLQEVHTIYLRRLKHMDKKHVENDGEGEHVKREYSCQWLVGGSTGFWRDQWYPSLQIHKPVYIAPYLKGNPDHPFKAPTKSVFKVAR